MKFLFIPCSDLHVTLFEPLVDEISKNPKNEVAFISVDSFERRNSEKLLNKKYSFTKFEDYKPSGYLNFKKNYYKFILRNLFKDNDIKFPPKYLSLLIKIALKSEKPDVIILGSDNLRSIYYVIKWAKKFNIPTILIQDRFTVPGRRENIRMELFSRKFRFFLGDYPKIGFYGYSGCNYFFTWGPKTKDEFIEKGIKATDIQVVGSTKMRYLNQLDKETNLKYLKSIGVDTSKEYILYTTTPIEPYGIRTFEDLEKSLFTIYNNFKFFPDYNLIIKLHPREDITLYYQLIPEEYKDKIKVFQDENIYNLIKNCRMLITELSTTAIEALAIGKVVLLLNLSNRKLHKNSIENRYLESETVVYVNNSHNFREALESALNYEKLVEKLNKNRIIFLKDYLLIDQNNSAEEIIKILID